MNPVETPLKTDAWIAASWDAYVKAVKDPELNRAKGYYYQGFMRLEMLPVGSDHSSDHALMLFAVSLYATLKGIAVTAKDNCSYRKVGIQECQPDISYYVGTKALAIPRGTNIVDLNKYPAPDVVIEIAKSSLLDDQGAKRLLYEDLGVGEYWIVDVERGKITAFTVANQGSYRIRESQLIVGLQMITLEQALKQSQEADQTQVGSWLMQQFSA
ncbi:Uma2 family endonuclease [Pseudanabaena sp. FACHB-2040]|uniref:Uma2 family endonuclease n=1 Tax=Pseudanabaena sp. FACHB-2040 TaxID=2692859 RepID=UPI0016843195|nr:Uma2 family endonuclease [Pseudanabaena sp. FACHB-2040]MBD2259057.1 Uma2 family endonuclease [Pseudanabaena sp. FACHB-2040]